MSPFLAPIASYPSLAGVLPDGGLDVGAGPRPLDGGRGLPIEGALQPERAVPEDPDVAGEVLGELGHLGGLAEVHPPLGHHLRHHRVAALCSHPVEENTPFRSRLSWIGNWSKFYDNLPNQIIFQLVLAIDIC